MLRRAWNLLLALMLAQKLWKHWAVWRFFRQRRPEPDGSPQLVSILQPILSGDPWLEDSLRRNVTMRTRYPIEWIWLIDSDDRAAHAICTRLQRAHPDRSIRIVDVPPPDGSSNPKTLKLVTGEALARGAILCVLDDDTVLPDGGLEQCLPLLDQPQAGLAFGLPYYRAFDTPWSALISLFVNDQSLLTYVPYTALSEPLTINGMFYAVRRDVWQRSGGWRGLEPVLADDFAVAQRVRESGLRLIQSPLRHAIRTHVSGPRHYLSLMQRWFIFPRESLLRHLPPRDRLLLVALAMLPALFPLPLLIATLLRSSRAQRWYTALYFAHSIVAFGHINRAYLSSATPWPLVPLAPLIEIMFPAQLGAALILPQRIVWRGHIMQVEPGGGFRFVRRRD